MSVITVTIKRYCAVCDDEMKEGQMAHSLTIGRPPCADQQWLWHVDCAASDWRPPGTDPKLSTTPKQEGN